jgi:hypothetical protein
MPYILLILMLALSPALPAAPTEDTRPATPRDGQLRAGSWDRLLRQRPPLAWETLRGYRMFFHPDDPEPLRRWLGVGVSKSGGDLTSAWALVRPYNEADPEGTWLRLEGVYSGLRDFAELEWDGLYRGAEFPDLRYRFNIEARFGDRKKSWKVAAVKSLDHPRFYKINGEKVTDNALVWDKAAGEYLPRGPKIFVSASQARRIPVLARVYLPELEGDFKVDGVLVMARKLDAGTDLGPMETSQWECVCAQFIPPDSPARKKLKSTRCWWDLPPNGAEGLWELKVALFHHITHRDQWGPCDMPLLDEDRVQVQVRP